MSTSEKEIPKSSEQSQSSEDQNQNSNQETSPTEEEVLDRDNLDPATKVYLESLENVLRDQRRTISDLSTRVTDVSTKLDKKEEVVADPDENRKLYFEDPVSTISQIIQKEIREQVKPLRDYVDGLRSTSKLDQAKNKIKSDSRFKDIWGSDIDEIVDSAFANGRNEPSEENVVGVVVQAIGMRTLTGRTSSKTTTKTEDKTVTTPPNIRPNNPAPIRTTVEDSNKPSRELTESEKRIARMNGLSDKDYLDWLDVPADKVIHSGISKKKES